MGKFKTQIVAPLSSRIKNSILEGKEVSSGGLKIYRLTNQVEGVKAFLWSLEIIEYCEEVEVFGWYSVISSLGSM